MSAWPEMQHFLSGYTEFAPFTPWVFAGKIEEKVRGYYIEGGVMKTVLKIFIPVTILALAVIGFNGVTGSFDK